MPHRIEQDQDAIDDVLNTCAEMEDEGQTKARSMTYEQGVKAGIEWITTKGFPPPTGEIEFIRIIVRIYIDGTLLMVKHVLVTEDNISRLVESTATAVVELTMDRFLYMIEFEFFDEPDPLHRFARFGTDTRRMRNPVSMDVKCEGKHGRN